MGAQGVAIRTRWRRGFSIIELAVVIVIASLLAVTVIPAMGSLDEARVRAAASELERRLAVARGFAVATGRPAGLEIDADLGRVRLVQIETGQTDVSSMTDPLGNEEDWLDLAEGYASVALAEVTLGDGADGSGVLWFGHDGTPELRSIAGLLLGDATDAATLRVSGFGRAWDVSVAPVTGALSVEDSS